MRKNTTHESKSLPINAQLRLEGNPAYEDNVVVERNPVYGQITDYEQGTGEQKHAVYISKL